MKIRSVPTGTKLDQAVLVANGPDSATPSRKRCCGSKRSGPICRFTGDVICCVVMISITLLCDYRVAQGDIARPKRRLIGG
jgi:hypothetical protein